MLYALAAIGRWFCPPKPVVAPPPPPADPPAPPSTPVVAPVETAPYPELPILNPSLVRNGEEDTYSV